MPPVLTPLATSADWLCRNTILALNTTLQHILGKHKDVFKGVGSHKYQQVKLLIDESVDPIVQPQQKILFAKRSQLDTILDELKAAHIIRLVEGSTNWMFNFVVTLKADSTQICKNVDMTTANTTVRRTKHIMPTLEELQYSSTTRCNSPSWIGTIATCRSKSIPAPDQSLRSVLIENCMDNEISLLAST